MTPPRICPCPEEPADGAVDFVKAQPVNAHIHEGCNVWHKGARCSVYQELPFGEER